MDEQWGERWDYSESWRFCVVTWSSILLDVGMSAMILGIEWWLDDWWVRLYEWIGDCRSMWIWSRMGVRGRVWKQSFWLYNCNFEFPQFSPDSPILSKWLILFNLLILLILYHNIDTLIHHPFLYFKLQLSRWTWSKLFKSNQQILL